MSKIALSGDASGTGTFTIASPNSNSNFTLTLPANTGTLLTSSSTVQGTLLKRTVQTFTTVKTTTSTTYQTDAFSLSYTPLASGNTLFVVFYGTCGWAGTTNGANYVGAIYRINCDGNFSDHFGMWVRDDGPSVKELAVQATQSLRYTTTGTSAITIRAEYRASDDQTGTVSARFNDWTASNLGNGATQNRFEIFEYAGSIAS
jgi:hypothetical protein